MWGVGVGVYWGDDGGKLYERVLGCIIRIKRDKMVKLQSLTGFYTPLLLQLFQSFPTSVTSVLLFLFCASSSWHDDIAGKITGKEKKRLRTRRVIKRKESVWFFSNFHDSSLYFWTVWLFSKSDCLIIFYCPQKRKSLHHRHMCVLECLLGGRNYSLLLVENPLAALWVKIYGDKIGMFIKIQIVCDVNFDIL